MPTQAVRVPPLGQSSLPPCAPPAPRSYLCAVLVTPLPLHARHASTGLRRTRPAPDCYMVCTCGVR